MPTPGTGPTDEGMWLFNHPPRLLLEQAYNFHPTDDWLEHVRQASVRFNSGGSGSFVSADGLVLTNHHVAADTLQKLSTPGRDYLQTRSPDLELNVLLNIEDVTARVNDAVHPGLTPTEAERARRAAMNEIERESFDRTGLRSDVVTLYHGGLYHLYRYKKYTDVRLVFAPEKDVAFLGGDPDNFEFPRYCLDAAFFRAYEDGRPARVGHFLKWSRGGAREGELVFVSGHPGRTDRLDTVAHLEFLRDRDFPTRLNVIRRREVLLRTFAERSAENARRAQDELFTYQNSRKARQGMLAGLQDPAVLDRKRGEERALRDRVRADAQLYEQFGDAWDQVAASLKAWDRLFLKHYLLERAVAFNSELFHIARTLLRLAEETQKPNADRLREYGEAGLESLKQQLFSEAPIYRDLEAVKLGDSLGMYVELAGAGHELVRQVLAGQSPARRAAALVAGTRLDEVAVRKRLADGGLKALEAANDPMLDLVGTVEDAARTARQQYEEQVEEPQRQAYGRLARARFAVFGPDVYPDATFTLRLAFGTARGYDEGGTPVPWATTLAGAYRHAEEHAHQPPFALPPSWRERRGRLDLDTPFNFVSTADIIGGNSGSPVVNRDAEVVGLIFDGNRDSLVLDFIYTDERARAVSVHSEGILEALRKVYDAGELVAELMG